jgi:hypothetical protein
LPPLAQSFTGPRHLVAFTALFTKYGLERSSSVRAAGSARCGDARGGGANGIFTTVDIFLFIFFPRSNASEIETQDNQNLEKRTRSNRFTVTIDSNSRVHS